MVNALRLSRAYRVGDSPCDRPKFGDSPGKPQPVVPLHAIRLSVVVSEMFHRNGAIIFSSGAELCRSVMRP